MDYPTFITLQPEFADTDVTLVNAELTSAALLVDSTVWGSLADTGIRYLTAHRLALSPFGQAARLVSKNGTTTYWTHYKTLQRTVGCAGSGLIL